MKYHKIVINKNITLFLISNVLLKYLVQGIEDNIASGLKP
jgi:hypothetical protein